MTAIRLLALMTDAEAVLTGGILKTLESFQDLQFPLRDPLQIVSEEEVRKILDQKSVPDITLTAIGNQLFDVQVLNTGIPFRTWPDYVRKRQLREKLQALFEPFPQACKEVTVLLQPDPWFYPEGFLTGLSARV